MGIFIRRMTTGHTLGVLSLHVNDIDIVLVFQILITMRNGSKLSEENR